MLLLPNLGLHTQSSSFLASLSIPEAPGRQARPCLPSSPCPRTFLSSLLSSERRLSSCSPWVGLPLVFSASGWPGASSVPYTGPTSNSLFHHHYAGHSGLTVLGSTPTAKALPDHPPAYPGAAAPQTPGPFPHTPSSWHNSNPPPCKLKSSKSSLLS